MSLLLTSDSFPCPQIFLVFRARAQFSLWYVIPISNVHVATVQQVVRETLKSMVLLTSISDSHCLFGEVSVFLTEE